MKPHSELGRNHSDVAKLQHEIAMPGAAVVLTVRHQLESEVLLQAHDIADRLVLDALELGIRHFALVRLFARLDEGGGPDEAADVLCAEGRIGTLHRVTFRKWSGPGKGAAAWQTIAHAAPVSCRLRVEVKAADITDCAGGDDEGTPAICRGCRGSFGHGRRIGACPDHLSGTANQDDRAGAGRGTDRRYGAPDGAKNAAVASADRHHRKSRWRGWCGGGTSRR